MKPKDLKARFTFEERTVLLEDGIFYVPEYFEKYKEFTFPLWSDPHIFGNDLPVALEFCAGNGYWIQQRAQSTQGKNWVAIEKRFDRVRKIWAKKKNHAINNLFIVCGEGETFATQFVPTASIAEVYINFPDPWPKQKHYKHRIMKESFLEEMARILIKRGKITFVTDDQSYFDTTLALFEKNTHYQDPLLMKDPIDYGSSYFDTLWREKGRSIYYVDYYRK